MGKIRSKLVTFVVNATDRESGKRETWSISLQGNRIREDRADWLKSANAYFSDIKLTKLTAAHTAKTKKNQDKADIARKGLEILDQLIAARNN